MLAGRRERREWLTHEFSKTEDTLASVRAAHLQWSLDAFALVDESCGASSCPAPVDERRLDERPRSFKSIQERYERVTGHRIDVSWEVAKLELTHKRWHAMQQLASEMGGHQQEWL